MPDGGYQRRFGDRRDGRLLRSLPPVSRLKPYLMTKQDAGLHGDTAEAGPAEDWLRMARQAGWAGIGFLHVFIAAYVRAVSQYPGLNRFVSGQKVYARNGIEVVMSVRRPLAGGTEETMIKILFDPADTVFDVYRKLGAKIDAINAGEDQGGPEQTAEGLMNIPGPLLKFVLWFLNLLDYFGLLPRSLLSLSPFHGSMSVVDFGGTGAAPFYRPAGHFGNLPLTAALGAKRVAAERSYIDYRLAMDVRAVSDTYLAAAFTYLKYHLEHPAALETPPEMVVEDVM